jgi:hypothetical protein
MENENCHDDWHFGTPDFASQAMPVNCQIAPKNVLKDITTWPVLAVQFTILIEAH